MRRKNFTLCAAMFTCGLLYVKQVLNVFFINCLKLLHGIVISNYSPLVKARKMSRTWLEDHYNKRRRDSADWRTEGTVIAKASSDELAVCCVSVIVSSAKAMTSPHSWHDTRWLRRRQKLDSKPHGGQKRMTNTAFISHKIWQTRLHKQRVGKFCAL